jgi:hypothetical protein
MGSHISAHRATIKYFSNSFIFKIEVEKEGLPGGITPALGAGGPEFKSRRPDHLLLYYQFRVNQELLGRVAQGSWRLQFGLSGAGPDLP